MDVRINEVQSQVQTVNSKSMLDPMVMREIVKACVQAVREDQARQKQLSEDRHMSFGSSANDN
jgi:outer membrane murein-binding lipoprotein Lpp